MDTRYIVSYGKYYLRPMSPCGVLLLDGNRRVIAHVVYELETDRGIPIVYDGNLKTLYQNWMTPGVRLDPQHLEYCCTPDGKRPQKPCPSVYCPCSSIQNIVNQIPYQWVQRRGELPALQRHWFDDVRGMRRDVFSADRLTEINLPVDEIKDLAKSWKLEWRSNNPCFLKLANDNEELYCELLKGDDNEDKPKFENFPLEIFEGIIRYLDGSSAANLCETSSLVETKTMEAFHSLPPTKKFTCWFDFCRNDLNQATMYKIWSSFDCKMGPAKLRAKDGVMNNYTWENVFTSYQKYWAILLNEKTTNTHLNRFEAKVKIEMLNHEDSDKANKGRVERCRITRCAGGGLLYNLLFPCPTTLCNATNLMVVENAQNTNCRHIAAVCRNSSTRPCFNSKVMYYPLVANLAAVEKPLPYLDRVLIGVCDQCITLSPLLGGTTRRMNVVRDEFPTYYVKMDPILEVYDNIFAVWLHPGLFVFYIIFPANTRGGYEFLELYRFNFPKIDHVWNRIAEYRSNYIPVIREYKGDTAMLNGDAKARMTRERDNLFYSKEPIYYGIAFVSHLYGVESFKPSERSSSEIEEPPATVLESLQPQFYVANGRKYLPDMREITCRGKGHGTFVFCSKKAIAVSWDCITWLCGRMIMPASIQKDDELTNITHVEVIHDNGLIAVIDENIVLMKISVRTSSNLPEPELDVLPVRVFNTGLMPLSMTITQLELSFDEGRPFLFVICDRKPFTVEGVHEEFRDDYGFVIKRIDF